MAYYNTCIYCGANLDPGEKCNCRNKATEKPFTGKELKDYNKKYAKYF